MKNILILSVLILTSACAARKTSDEVQQRLDEQKLSGEWDRRPEVALNKKMVYEQTGTCEEGNLRFHGLTLRILNAKGEGQTLVMTIFFRANQTYKAFWRIDSYLASGDILFGDNSTSTLEGTWISRTDYGLDIKEIGMVQFDEKMTSGKIKLAGKSITPLTSATDGYANIEALTMNIDGASVQTLCP